MRLPGAVLGLLLLGGSLSTVPLAAQARTGKVAVNGVTLHYQIEGAGKPLVLIHGWAVDQTEWDNVVGDLARRYRVVRYDRRGFGTSSGKPDPTADAADLKGLLDSLGIPRAHILGHSAGALVALTFALRYPESVEGLILLGCGPPVGFNPPGDGPDAPQPARWAAIARTQGLDSLRAAISEWVHRVMFHGQPAPAPIEAHLQALLRSYRGTEFLDPAPPSNLAPPARADELRKVHTPTLVLIGDEEIPYLQVVAAGLHYGITGSRMVVIPGGGHAINLQEPERFTAETLRFLRLVDTGDATPGS